jgi:hypothetical protein
MRKNKSGTCGIEAAVEATATQRQWQLWLTVCGSSGVGGGVGNGVCRTVATMVRHQSTKKWQQL